MFQFALYLVRWGLPPGRGSPTGYPRTCRNLGDRCFLGLPQASVLLALVIGGSTAYPPTSWDIPLKKINQNYGLPTVLSYNPGESDLGAGFWPGRGIIEKHFGQRPQPKVFRYVGVPLETPSRKGQQPGHLVGFQGGST